MPSADRFHTSHLKKCQILAGMILWSFWSRCSFSTICPLSPVSCTDFTTVSLERATTPNARLTLGPHRTRKPLAASIDLPRMTSQALMSMGSMGLQTVDVSDVTTILAAEAAVAILGAVRWTVFHRGSSASGFLNI